MTFAGWLQIVLVLAVTAAAAWGLGRYMAALFSGGRTFLSPVLSPVESGIRRVCGISGTEQDWKSYTLAMLAFNALGFLFLYGLMRLQGVLPLNPQGFGAVPEALSFNTAMSFVTNTNWQSYGGESTMSNLVQMTGLAVQNFLSAATGIALAVAFTRAFARSGTSNAGQFLGRSRQVDALRPAADFGGHRHRLCGAGDAADPARALSMPPRSRAPSR